MAQKITGTGKPLPTEPRLVSLDVGGELLGISRSGAHNLVVAGELEAVRIGRRLCIVVESLDRYVERLRRDGAQ